MLFLGLFVVALLLHQLAQLSVERSFVIVRTSFAGGFFGTIYSRKLAVFLGCHFPLRLIKIKFLVIRSISYLFGVSKYAIASLYGWG